MTCQAGRRMAREATVNGTCGAKKAMSKDIPGRCPSCLKTLEGKRASARFCCDRCRLLFWATHELAAALRAGQIEGLRDELGRLADAAKLIRSPQVHSRTRHPVSISQAFGGQNES